MLHVEIDVEADLELGVSAHWGNHTGAEWIDSHCKNSLNVYWDYTDCKANRMCSGGESSCTLYSNNGTSAYVAVNSYRGSLRLKLYRKNTWGNWKLQESRFINEGYTAYVADTITWKRGQKVALSEAGGTAFHYEVLAYY